MTEPRFYITESAWEKTKDGERAIEWLVRDRKRKATVVNEAEDWMLGDAWSLEDATMIADALNAFETVQKLESVNANLNKELRAVSAERDALLESALAKEREAMKWQLQEFEVRMRRTNKLLEDARKVLDPNAE